MCGKNLYLPKNIKLYIEKKIFFLSNLNILVILLSRALCKYLKKSDRQQMLDTTTQCACMCKYKMINMTYTARSIAYRKMCSRFKKDYGRAHVMQVHLNLPYRSIIENSITAKRMDNL